MDGHSKGVKSIVVTRGDQFVISASWDGTLKVWERQTGELVRTLEGHSVYRVVPSPDGWRCASSRGNGEIKIWNIREGKELMTLPGHAGRAVALALHPDGKRLLSGGQEHKALVWDLQDGQLSFVLEGYAIGTVRQIVITPDGRHALAAPGEKDHAVRVWDLENGSTAQILRGHEGDVVAVAALPDNRHAVSAALDNTLRFWELKEGRELTKFVCDSPVRSCSLAVVPSAGTVIAVVGEENGRVHFLRLEGISNE